MFNRYMELRAILRERAERERELLENYRKKVTTKKLLEIAQMRGNNVLEKIEEIEREIVEIAKCFPKGSFFFFIAFALSKIVTTLISSIVLLHSMNNPWLPFMIAWIFILILYFWQKNADRRSVRLFSSFFISVEIVFLIGLITTRYY